MADEHQMRTLRREATGDWLCALSQRTRTANRDRDLPALLGHWLQKQTQIINHYGLDLTSPDAQNFLFDNIKGFLFNESLPVTEQAEIDTTKEGTVKW